MAKTRTYNVSLIPASCRDGILSFAIFDKHTKKYSVEAATFDELGAAIRKLVQDDFKMDCTKMINFAKGERKPPGFDKWHYANTFIEYVPPVEKAA